MKFYSILIKAGIEIFCQAKNFSANVLYELKTKDEPIRKLCCSAVVPHIVTTGLLNSYFYKHILMA